MPPRFHPNQTVALVGIKPDCRSGDLKTLVDGLKGHLGMVTVPKLFTDKSDSGAEKENRRHFVYLNCKSQVDAQEVIESLHAKPNKDLGIDKYQWMLQAVTKTNLRGLSWKELAQVETLAVEGKVVRKGLCSCTISDQGVAVFVERQLLENCSDGAWNMVKSVDGALFATSVFCSIFSKTNAITRTQRAICVRD